MEPSAVSEKQKQDSKEEIILDQIDIEKSLKEYELLNDKCEVIIKKINKRKMKNVEKRK